MDRPASAAAVRRDAADHDHRQRAERPRTAPRAALADAGRAVLPLHAAGPGDREHRRDGHAGTVRGARRRGCRDRPARGCARRVRAHDRHPAHRERRAGAGDQDAQRRGREHHRIRPVRLADQEADRTASTPSWPTTPATRVAAPSSAAASRLPPCSQPSCSPSSCRDCSSTRSARCAKAPTTWHRSSCPRRSRGSVPATTPGRSPRSTSRRTKRSVSSPAPSTTCTARR